MVQLLRYSSSVAALVWLSSMALAWPFRTGFADDRWKRSEILWLRYLGLQHTRPGLDTFHLLKLVQSNEWVEHHEKTCSISHGIPLIPGIGQKADQCRLHYVMRWNLIAWLNLELPRPCHYYMLHKYEDKVGQYWQKRVFHWIVFKL